MSWTPHTTWWSALHATRASNREEGDLVQQWRKQCNLPFTCPKAAEWEIPGLPMMDQRRSANSGHNTASHLLYRVDPKDQKASVANSSHITTPALGWDQKNLRGPVASNSGQLTSSPLHYSGVQNDQRGSVAFNHGHNTAPALAL